MKATLAMEPIAIAEAVNYLDAYLAERVDRGSAVLITGNWGSGKTEFIKRYLAERQRKSPGQLPALIASFFGAQNEAAISDQFLSQLYPSLNSKIGKVLGTAAFRLGNTLLSANLGEAPLELSDVEAIRQWAAKPKDRVVVFDDLERATFGVDRALSLINGYVETDGLRVIVLANEADISCPRYTKWKEKVVGKSLYVRADPEQVIEAVAHELPYGSVQRYLRTNPTRVAEVLQAGGMTNYRSFRVLMGDADRLVSRVDPRLGKSQKGVESVVLFSVGVGSELRAGLVTADEVAMMGKDYRRHIKSRESWDDRDIHLDAVEKRYRDLAAYEPVVPPSHLATLWMSGTLQIDAINAVLSVDPVVVGEAAAPAWRKMWDLWSMSTSQYDSARLELVSDLESSRILRAGELLHAVGISLLLEEWGVELIAGRRTLDWLEEYLLREDVSKGLELTGSRYDLSESYGSLGYHQRETSSFMSAVRLVNCAANEAALYRAALEVPKYVAQIAAGDYSSIHAFGGGSLVGQAVPWLQNVDPAVMGNMIVSDGKVNRGLLAALDARYAGDMDAAVQAEWNWLREVRKQVRRITSDLPAPQRQICTGLAVQSMRNITRWVIRAARVSKATRVV